MDLIIRCLKLFTLSLCSNRSLTCIKKSASHIMRVTVLIYAQVHPVQCYSEGANQETELLSYFETKFDQTI